jgi:hypothetical protein
VRVANAVNADSTSARVPCAVDASKNVDSMVSRCGRHDEPTQLVKVLRTLNLIRKSLAVRPMVIAVVFQREHHDLPPHIQVVRATTVGTQYRNLRPRSREPGANYQEPQPRFLWRFCARIHETQRDLELA